MKGVGALGGRTALVTGPRTGIGRACALRLAREGADLVLWGHTPMRELVEEVEALGRSVDVVQQDLTDLEGTRQAVEALLARTPIDVLVNNAGIIRRSPAAQMEWADWQEVIDVNLHAVFALSQACGRAMVERGEGSIVTIASLLSFQGGVFVPGYAASKHAVAGLTKALANEWAVSGVRVNAVAPGYIETSNTEALRNDRGREEAIRSRIPTGRWGQPEDIAGPVAFLAGPDSRYVNGHILVVDGGWMGR